MSSINSRVPPLRLMAVDTPSDGQLPSYQSSSGKFEWVDDASGGSPGGSDGDFQINNSGSFGGSILSTNKTTTITLNSGASGDPQIQMSSNTKAITLTCDSNSKLKVEGALYSWELDASSASGGITFPDGTTQTTAASGSSGVIGAFPDLSSFSPTAGGDILETSTLQPTNFFQPSNKTLSTFESYHYYFPITVNTAKTYTTIGLYATTAATGNQVTVAIYDSADNTHLPQNKLASAVVNMTATGTQTATLTVEAGQSMALTKGQFVWAAIRYTAGSDNTRSIRCTDEFDQYNLGINLTSGSYFAFNCIASNTIPSTFASSDFVSTFSIEPPVLEWS